MSAPTAPTNHASANTKMSRRSFKAIGVPGCVFGHSSGAAWVLGGAARAAAACRAIALYEPRPSRESTSDTRGRLNALSVRRSPTAATPTPF